MKKVHYIAVLLLTIAATSCEKDQFTKSIFVDPVVNVDAYTYGFDCWLDTVFTQHYNVEFKYKLDDNAMDPNYNVVPVRIGMADTIAHLALYLWYDVYDTIVGESFLTTYGPKMIQLVGSSMINAAQGTEKLGYAEGGIKITLMKINATNITDIDMLNHYIFQTMHHEFSHILHQKKTYPKEFETITPADYDPSGWQYEYDESISDLWKREHKAWEKGYVTCYGKSEAHEDFVEMIANYIVQSDENWQYMLEHAGDKRGALEQKLEIVRTWLWDNYEYDLDAMHVEVQRRQKLLVNDFSIVMKTDYTK